jgi:hypothetical protein
MKTMPELTRTELLIELILANHLLLTCVKSKDSSRDEKLAARAYLKAIVEEVERRRDLELQQEAA